MSDDLKQVGKTINKIASDVDIATKRYKSRVFTERAVDTFDAIVPFEMFFKTIDDRYGRIFLDLFFRPPRGTGCCSGGYCSICERFPAGSTEVQLTYGYIPGTPQIFIDTGSSSNTGSFSPAFASGAWVHAPINVTAGGSVLITANRTAGPNALINGIFLGGSTSSFGVSIPGVQGTWVGNYGSDGYILARWNFRTDLASLPAGVSYTLEQAYGYSFTGAVADVRALQNPENTERRARAWYHASRISVRLHFDAPYSGMLHIYAVDWDSAGRTQTVTVDDNSHTVEVTAFEETYPNAGIITLDSPAIEEVRICYVTGENTPQFIPPGGGGSIGGGGTDVVPPNPPAIPPPIPPDGGGGPIGGGTIAQFPGSGPSTQAAFEALLRDMTIDTIEIASGIYMNWHVYTRLSRAARPLLVRPATNAIVIWDDTGGGSGTNGLFYFGANVGLPGVPTFATDYITFDPTGTGGQFKIQNYSIGATGLIYTGWINHITLNGFVVRNCGGTAGTSHNLYVSSDDNHRGMNLIANGWNVAGTPNLSGVQTYHTPNVSSVILHSWIIDGAHRAAYLWADASGIDVNGWTISNCTATFDVFETSSGVIKNCHATNSGPMSPGSGFWINTSVTNGGGNSAV